jgi:membrane protein DedA with SNARE-associated domain
VRRTTLAIALLGTLAWCLLLFGIGLDDLQNGRTEPGIIFAIVALAVLIAGLVYAVWRTAAPLRRQDRAASRR